MRTIILSVLVSTFLFAGAARAESVFVPTSGWLVGPATLVADGEAGLPCVMMNQFSNGFVMRVSGGGRQIMGFALDVRQNHFTPGNEYELGVAVAPGFRKIFKAQAYDPATIMAATQDAPEFYSALRDAREMSIGLDGKVMKFVMVGVRDGLDRMENCFDPKGAKAPARAAASSAAMPQMPDSPTMAGMHTAAPPAGKSDVASAYRALLMGEDEAANKETAPAAEAEAKDAAAPLTAKAAQGQTMPPANTAVRPAAPKVGEPVAPKALDGMAPSAGEASRLDAVFSKAEESIRSQKPATPAKPTAPMAATTGQPKLQPAPALPVRSFPGATGVPAGQPLMQNGIVPIVPPAPPAPRQVQVSAPAQSVAHTREWRASQGVALREVLENWSNNAGARLVWKAQGDFTLPAGLTAQGTYESAVLSALRQFEGGDGVQPLGEIYNDPATGQKVLVISE
jgi:hypothetical protein